MRTLDPVHCLAAVAAAVAPAAAFAHSGHGGPTNLWQGFIHPLGGVDHVLAMLAVGMIAARLGGRARWALPASFIAAMGVGGVWGMTGLALPGPETGVAVSVVALGVLVALRISYSTTVLAAVVALSALFHGFAHGLEAPATGSGLAFGVGFLVATGLLHLCGIGLGTAIQRLDHRRLWAELGGSAIAVAGVGLLVGAALT